MKTPVTWTVSKGSDPAPVVQAAERLTAAGNDNALREARKLWGKAFPRRFSDYDEVKDGTMIARFEDLVARRIAKEPMSHLLGYRDFYNHRFYVTPDVLDPRPDTEALVMAALDQPFEKVLDMGTGSGCILLSLLKERRNATGCGTDVSAAALDVAIRNAHKLEIDHQAEFVLSDWFANVSDTFDLIVSNPPYIAAAEMDDLQPEVRDHEPRIALTDEADGLTHYRHIIAHHGPYLNAGGRLMVEIGPTQAAAVTAMMQAAKLTEISVIPDLDGRDRVVWGRKPRKTA